jgi:hypothetical protein
MRYFLFDKSCRRLRSFWRPSHFLQAAEKRQAAEISCRFSGIAALPMPAKPRFMAFGELARRLLCSSYEKTGHPKVTRT